MATNIDPVLYQWYRYLNKGQNFTVVDIDEVNSLIEVQHYDGDLEEISFDEWLDLDIELSEAPDNWTGPIDVGEIDDLGTEITDTTEEEWSQPLDEFANPDEEKLVLENEEIAEQEFKVLLGEGEV